MADQDKARTQRLRRLEGMFEKGLENPSAALEVLLTELALGAPRPELWEQFHAAAAGAGKEQELAGVYVKAASGRRMQQLDQRSQAELLLHAADFYQGVLGDALTSENFLERVMYIMPGHPEAFARLERRFVALADPRRLIDLYSLVAREPPGAAGDLASKVLNKIVPLPAASPLDEDVCKRLIAFVPVLPTLLEVLEAHCRKTRRPALACALIEQALTEGAVSGMQAREARRLLVALHVGETANPAAAIAHVEELLTESPSDEVARAAAEKLLSIRAVAPRAAAALQKARRLSRAPG